MDKTYLAWLTSLACSSLIAFASPNRERVEPIGIFEDRAVRRKRSSSRLGRFRCGEKNLHRRRQRREYVVQSRRVLLRLEKSDRRCCDLGGHLFFTRKNPHRKGCLIIRQSLDADSVYADAALHGDGLTSLQFRDAKGETTHEVQANGVAPKRLQIEKRGNYVYMSVANDGEDLHPSGSSARIAFEGSFYVGIGVTSHDKDVIEKAVFSNVDLKTDLPASSENQFCTARLR